MLIWELFEESEDVLEPVESGLVLELQVSPGEYDRHSARATASSTAIVPPCPSQGVKP